MIHDPLFPTLPERGFTGSDCDFYAQTFFSVVVPTDGRDVTLFDNDLGVGYFAYRDSTGDRLVTSVVPVMESPRHHPLNHRGRLYRFPLPASIWWTLTFGTSFGIGRKSSLTFGAAVPVVGPCPFDLEAQVLFNRRF